jgi:hypothetical protein
VSKERAQRRAVREQEAAVRAAARAAEQERRERRAARKKSITRRLPKWGTGRQTGTLARRRRNQTRFLVVLLVALNVLLWSEREEWGIRVGALIVSILAAPVLHTLLFRRR